MNGKDQDSVLTGTTVASASASGKGEPKAWIEVDARGLEPPQPLVIILEALGQLPPGAALRARTDRRPMHLYAMLESRGFIGQSEAQSDGSFITFIRSR